MQQARRLGALRAIAVCQCFNGALEFQATHWPEAEAALRESIQVFRQIGASAGEALACQHLGGLQTARGQLEEGLCTLEDGVVAAKRALLRAHLLGRLHAAMARNRLLAGDLPAADQALSLGFTLTESHGHCVMCESLLLPVAVSIRIAQGELVAAEEYYHQLDAAATQYGSRTWVGLACQARGELAAARGDIEAALAHYAEAQAGFQAAGNEYEATQCLEAMTRLQQQQSTPGLVAAQA
jgi:predicted negative regulator of RcsB-dependent stress response